MQINFDKFNNKMNKDYLRHPQRQHDAMSGEYTLRNSFQNGSGGQKSSRRAYQKYGKDQFEDETDSKIMEIRKKYQDVPLRQTSTNMMRKKQYRSSEKDEEIFKKLTTIKAELKSIPNWEKYARSFFFEQNSQNTNISPSQFSSRKLEYHEQKYHLPVPSKSKEILKNPNKTYEIRQTSSIDQSDEKSLKKIDRKAYINEFQLGHSYHKQDYVKPKELQPSASKKIRHQQNYEKSNKVDERIYEIESRIKDFERKKKNLNIDYVPFQQRLNHNRSFSNLEKKNKDFKKQQSYIHTQKSCHKQKDLSKPPKYKSSSKKKPTINDFSRDIIIHHDQSMVSPTFACIRETESSKFDFQEKYYENKYIPSRQSQQLYRHEAVPSSTASSKYGNKLQRDFSQASFRAKNDTQSEKYVYDCEREKEAEERIERRKKKVCEYDFKKQKNYTIQALVSAFSEQAKLDENFRNNKLWFNTCKNEKKWQRLQSLVQIQGINLSLNQLENEFQISQQEDNPFYSVGSQPSDLETAAKSFTDCEKHWEKFIYRRFTWNALRQEGFKNEMIDMDKKGFLVLEDFVRFLNMETGTFFRNRDIFCIFKRLAKGAEKITFDKLISQICQ